jgi:CDP-glucose 4,6-dehydratase
MQNNLFKNKNILITGITGFVGKNLARTLEDLGADVYGISRTTSSQKILKTNIVNLVQVDEFIKNKKIQICFHLAGESLVEKGQVDPYNVFRVNTQGTLNIIECGRKYKLEKIIIASTSHVYGKNKVPYFEGYTPRPSRPYETSKACTDLIAQSYADTFKLPILIPRFVNIYGPGDLNFNRLIPKTIKSLLSNESPQMWGGEGVRDYLYITDAIDAYVKLALLDFKKVGTNKIFNFGSNNQISVMDLIEKIILLSGSKMGITKIKEQRAEEIKAQYVSFNKARKILNWDAKMDLNEGIKRTIDWYRDYLHD